MLSKKALFDYMELYRKEFGEEISYEQAQEQGTKLLRLFSLIFKTIPKKWLKPIKK